MSWTSSSMKELFFGASMKILENGDEWVFYRKGNANLIYSYAGDDNKYKNKLLRLRRATQTFDTKDVYQFMETKIRPHLPKTIQADLVAVKFNKDDCLNDGFGLLLPNLLPATSVIINEDRYIKLYKTEDSHILELKPKWLVRTANGCRNCAHHRLKFQEEPRFCTLSLLEPGKLKDVLGALTDDTMLLQALEKYFRGTDNCLRTLERLQRDDLNLENLVEETDGAEDICLQMTLRDVTVFIEIFSFNKELTIIETVTDTDPKSSIKLKSWKSTHKKLIDGQHFRGH